jgi:transcription antitermination protein NusB
MANNTERNTEKAIIQCLYAWQANPKSIDILIEKLKENKTTSVDESILHQTLEAIIEQKETLDTIIQSALDREMNRISAIEQAILRVGCYRLNESHRATHPIIIANMLTLTKFFVTKSQCKYVNAVLDAISKQDQPKG